MIVPVDETNLLQAATIHSISWKESHRVFCTPDFIETHTPDRQREYLRNKMNNGTKLYMLIEEKPTVLTRRFVEVKYHDIFIFFQICKTWVMERNCYYTQ